MSSPAALVLGASGSVGQALIEALVRSNAFDPIVALVRRPGAVAPETGEAVHEAVVSDMNPESLDAATFNSARGLQGNAVGLSVLGIGAGTARLTLEAHRAVDVHLNAAFARGLKRSGRVSHLAFMSAAGANPAAATSGSGAPGMARYARVKGEAEEAVKQNGPAVVSIFRPAMIIGSKHTPWLLEKILPLFTPVTPANYRSITAMQIAKAMVATSIEPPATAAVYHYPEMMTLNKVSSRGVDF